MKRYALFLMLLAAPLLAQRGGVSYIQYLENGVTILPADGSSPLQAGLNIPLYPGDRLETERMARMEVALAEGSLFWIDQRSKLELRALALTDGFSDQRSYLYLGEGQAALEILADPERGAEPVLGFAGGDFYAFSSGLYSLELRGRSATLRLFSGRGELVTDRGSVLLQAGEEAIAYEDGFVDRRRLRRDNEAFASFVEGRRELRLRSQSAQYTGEALSAYSYELDQNGSWVYMSDIGGYAWRPVVAVGWQPYYNGYWHWYHNDWFWVGYEPWSYITHHYGRWSMFPGYGWAWVPGYAWAPSWVYWYYDPFYIGWSPLGYWDYWWWSCCHNCWGWDHHHGHHDGDHHGDHDGDHDGDHGGDGGQGGGRHMNGHVNLAKLDHGAFVFSQSDQFGKGKGTLTRGAEFKGRLDSKGAIKAMELPLGRTDLANPGPVLKKAVLDAKTDLTPLFKKDFTATPQVKEMLTTARAKALAGATPAAAGLERSASPASGQPRTVGLPSGQSPQRQPKLGASPSAAPSRPVGGTVTRTPAPSAPAREASPSSAPQPSSTPSASPAPRPLPSSSGKAAAPPSGKAAPAPSTQPSPKAAPSDPKEIKPGKSNYLVTNVSDDGGAGAIRVEDAGGQPRPYTGGGTVSVVGDAHWTRSGAETEVQNVVPSGRQPVQSGSSNPVHTSTYFDRRPVSVPSTTPSYQPSSGDYYRPTSSYGVEYSTPSRPTHGYSSPNTSTPSGTSRTYHAPPSSHSAPSGSGRIYSAPAPSPSGGHSAPSGGGHSAPSSGSHSAPSGSHSSPSASSHSAPRK